MSEEIRCGKYRHFKGKEYEVLGLATHSETEEQMVVYRPLYGEGKLWVSESPLERTGGAQPGSSPHADQGQDWILFSITHPPQAPAH